ncbi:hypothetical protein FH968_00130 [Buttiauxella sp. B2]|uniref:hypothetical protein n=1 Tax=Buttiauxella sp. B2 TaxID=2587812 RepID=UPI001123B82D|nr:hypothetical protein [Buttiauxella sp. B2]TNV22507.1 hypothetical protein FH968_00130 [Buttiauxella sp. B2]
MHILAHRGDWHSPHEKNSHLALRRALNSGWGIETDIRDLDGELVISHDMPRAGALPLSTVLDDYVALRATGMLALNIKSDGLMSALKAQLSARGIRRYFCFDMSVPDMLPYQFAGMATAARLSEYEPEGPLSMAAPVLWVDGFHQLSVNEVQLTHWLTAGKTVCLVSPELHGRDPYPLWQQMAGWPKVLRHHPQLMLCTDCPALVQGGGI